MTDAEYRLALDTPLSKKVKNGLAVLKAYAEGAANRDMFAGQEPGHKCAPPPSGVGDFFGTGRHCRWPWPTPLGSV